MLIQYAILSLLKNKPMSGYDLKKAMQSSLHMPWSGNNNQIYRALSQLCAEGMAEGKTLHQDGSPTKKIYTITGKGVAALENWAKASRPQLPEFKNSFLIQLGAIEDSDTEALQKLLIQYKDEVQTQLVMQKEIWRRQGNNHEKIKLADDLIFGNIQGFYQAELNWATDALDKINKI